VRDVFETQCKTDCKQKANLFLNAHILSDLVYFATEPSGENSFTVSSSPIFLFFFFKFSIKLLSPIFIFHPK